MIDFPFAEQAGNSSLVSMPKPEPGIRTLAPEQGWVDTNRSI